MKKTRMEKTYALVGWTIDDLREVMSSMELPERTDEDLDRFMHRNSGGLEDSIRSAGNTALKELVNAFPHDFDLDLDRYICRQMLCGCGWRDLLYNIQEGDQPECPQCGHLFPSYEKESRNE